MKHSIPEESLDRFLAGTASGQERRAVAAHLLQGCPICARRLRTFAWPGRRPAGSTVVLDPRPVLRAVPRV